MNEEQKRKIVDKLWKIDDPKLWKSVDKHKSKRDQVMYVNKLDYYNYEPTDIVIYPFEDRKDYNEFEEHCIKLIKENK